MSVNKFIEKLKKSQKEEIFEKGRRVSLYNNDYEVVGKAGSNIIILKDFKSHKFWMHESELNNLLHKGAVSVTTIKKANIKNPGARGGKVVGYTKTGEPIYEKGHISGGRRSTGEHAIDVTTGDTYEHHGDGAEKVNLGRLLDDNDKKVMKQLSSEIRQNIDKKHHGQAAELMEKFLESKLKMKNVRQHLDSELKDRGRGSKLFSAEVSNLSKLEKESKSNLNKLVSFLKENKRK